MNQRVTPTPSAPAGVPRTLEWVGGEGGVLRLLDQTKLPGVVEFIDCTTVEQVHEAIRQLRVRGAPAIGLAGAFGLCLGCRVLNASTSLPGFRKRVEQVADYLIGARPTAVNLAWAVEQVREIGRSATGEDIATVWRRMLDCANRLLAEDEDVCRRIGESGAGLIRDGWGVLTHCNAGALATSQHGTALAVMYEAQRRGRKFRVYADETRPLLQGLRLTAFELAAAGIDTTVICDNAAAALMASGAVQIVLVGADRIARNGDTANKIGTYGLAVLAQYHRIPFYVAAPRSTFDLTIAGGSSIPIELRSENEITSALAGAVAPPGAKCHNPAFDVTPAGLIQGIVTESGLLEPVSESGIRKIFG